MKEEQKSRTSDEDVAILRKKLEILEEENRFLKERSFLLNVLMDNIPDSIYFKDDDSRFITINKKQADILGVSNALDAKGKTDFDYFETGHAQSAFEDEQKIIKDGLPLVCKLEKIKHSNGEYRYVTATKVPFKNEKGEITGIAGISRDVTEMYLAEEKVKRYADELDLLNKTKDKFFSIIAHDLKNPFNAITGFSNYLLTDFQEIEESEKLEIIERIHKVSQFAYNLLENLLIWSKSQTGRIDFRPQKADLSEIINKNVSELQLLADKKSITLKAEAAEGIFAVIDKNMIDTVIRNLIMNAIKFTYHRGEVFIGLKGYGNSTVINIKDNGMGIPQKTLNKLFKLDEHITTVGSDREKGSGLGLILCKEFIDYHKGSISVESTPGKGTNVIIRL